MTILFCGGTQWSQGLSQCRVSGKTIIKDEENEMADTTLLQIVIDNAVNNNLSHPLQGLCGVSLRFKHPFVKELAIELISPAGQKITLVGGNISAYFTGFVTWDVKFVQSPPEGSASPDPGFSEVWENDQDWENFKTYKGDYYPHSGRLQNFNTGPVNGTWTLRCIDFVDFGEGEILNFQLFFCDDEGLKCEACRLDSGFYPIPDFNACTGSQNLLIETGKTFLLHPPQALSNHIYSNIIFKDSNIYDYAVVPDLRQASPGVYTICPLQYAPIESMKLPAIGSAISKDSVNVIFTNACAILADSCLQIHISDNTISTVVDSLICNGDSVLFHNQTFKEPGIYTVRIPNGICDSVVELRLNVLDIQVNILPDRDSLDCLNNTLSLVGFASANQPGNLTYFWSGKNHDVDTDPTDFVVDVSKPDIYYLNVIFSSTNISCAVTDSIQIFVDNSVPKINLNADTLTCLLTQSEITISSSKTLVNTMWESVEGHTIQPFGLNARVENPGKYKVIAIADNGCSVIDSITIIEDKQVQTPSFYADTLNCVRTEVAINLSHQDNRTYSYFWTGVRAGTEYHKDPIADMPGQKIIELTDETNGCKATFITEIIQDISKPEITNIVADTLTCSRIFIIPQVESDKNIIAYLWNGPGLSSNSPSPSISQAGIFNIKITAPNGCEKDSLFSVVADTVRANLSLVADKLSCNKTEVNILLTTNQDVIDYLWSGPEGFISTEASPLVRKPGIYFVTVTANNGCKTLSQVIIENDDDIPNVLFDTPDISCLQDTVTILVTSTQGRDYNYFWSGPGVITPTEKNANVYLPGLYQLTVTDGLTGCTAVFSVNVADSRIYPAVNLESELLNCVKDSIRIILTSDMPLQSVKYTGPEGFLSTTQSPFIRKEGWYFVEYTNMLECSGRDSVFIERNDRFPMISTGNYSIQCRQDSILVTGNSDIEGTQFSWVGPSGFNKSGPQVFVYRGGTYQLIGMAPNQCVSTITFEIQYDTLRPDLAVFPPDVLTCSNPVTTAKAISQTEGVSFLWTGPETLSGQMVELSIPGIYILTATAPNQCSESLIIAVEEEKTFPEFTVFSDTLDCSIEQTLVMLNTSSENIVTWNSSNPLLPSDNARSFETSVPGIYRFTITNAEQCVTEGSIEVIRDVRIPQIESYSLDSITCKNASVTIGVNVDTPVASYIWEGPSIIDNSGAAVTVNEGGIYLLRIIGENGCIKDTNFIVIKNRELPEFTTFTDTLTCEKGKINIGVNPLSDVVSYEWSGPNFSSTVRNPVVLSPGIYSVTVTNSNGCSSSANVMVFEDFKSPEIAFPEMITLPCNGLPLNLQVQSVDNLIRYKWTFPDGTSSHESNPSSKGEGMYSIQVVGKNGCLSETKVFEAIIESRKPEYDISSDTITCIKTKGILQAKTSAISLNFFWKGPDDSIFNGSSIEVNKAGDYQLVVSDSLLCSDTVLVRLHIDTLTPVFQIIQEGAIVCESTDVTLKTDDLISGRNYLFMWNTTNGIILTSDKQHSIKAGITGTYSVYITDANNGCSAFKSYTIQETSSSLTSLSADVQSPSCSEYQNGSITIENIDGIPPYAILMNGQNVGQNLSFNFLSSGSYNFRIKDALGCVLDTTLIIKEAVDPVIDLPGEIDILFGDSVLIEAEIFPDNPTGWTSKWYSNKEVICIDCRSVSVMPFVNTVYNFEISVDGKCKRSASVLVKVKNDLNTSVPNVFRPGSLSGNDRFYIPQRRGIEKIISLIVIDKWAEPVFASFDHLPGDSNVGWDGTFNGKDAAPGVYVVVAEMLLTNGRRYRYVGDLTLVR